MIRLLLVFVELQKPFRQYHVRLQYLQGSCLCSGARSLSSCGAISISFSSCGVLVVFISSFLFLRLRESVYFAATFLACCFSAFLPRTSDGVEHTSSDVCADFDADVAMRSTSLFCVLESGDEGLVDFTFESALDLNTNTPTLNQD